MAEDTTALTRSLPADGDPAPPGPMVPPTSPAGYEILRELGRGGMGVVYLARQTALGRLVALKMILAGGHASPTARGRFVQEGRAVAALEHPNVVRVYEAGEHDGLPYLAMELCEGGSLADRIRDRPLPPGDAARLVERVARGVAAAHAAGLVHRDLKPDNVLLARASTTEGSEQPKVTDFGLAKQVECAGPTVSGSVLGTPSYMAPEQAEGKAVGPACDVYALGAILYECLTGRPPFRAATVLETLHQVRSQEPAPARQVNPAVPRDLETIAARCLRKEPGRRYASAAALADDLAAFLAGRPIQARPVGAVERAVLWTRRNRTVASLIAAVALALVVGTAVSVYFAVRAEANADAAMQRLYAADMNLAGHAWDAGHVARVLDLLQRHDAAPGARDRRGFEWHYLWRCCHAEWRTLGGQGRWIRTLAFSPDGTRLATGGYDAKVRVWDVASGDLLHTLDRHTEYVHRVAFSPDGSWLASAGDDRTVRVWDAKTGREVRAFAEHPNAVWAVAFSPDGRELAAADREGNICVWAVDGWHGVGDYPSAIGWTDSLTYAPDGRLAVATYQGSVLVWDVYKTTVTCWPVDPNEYGIRSVAFSPDGAQLACGCGWERLILWDCAAGTARNLRHAGRPGDVNSLWGVAFSPDGQTLASACWDGTVKLWDVATGTERATLRGHTDAVKAVAFCPTDGTLLATASKDGTLKLWRLPVVQGTVELDAADAPPLPKPTEAASPDGRWTATIDDGAVVVRGNDGRPARTYRAPDTTFAAVAFSRDGTELAAAGGTDDRDRTFGTVRFWDLGTGAEGRPLRELFGAVTAVAYSPDGKTLTTGDKTGAVKLWNLATRHETLTLLSAGDAVGGLAFVDGGGRLVARLGGDPGPHSYRAWTATPPGR